MDFQDEWWHVPQAVNQEEEHLYEYERETGGSGIPYSGPNNTALFPELGALDQLAPVVNQYQVEMWPPYTEWRPVAHQASIASNS